MADPAILVRGLGGGYGPLQVVWDLDLAVESGRSMVLLGANGAGKSTLLRLILGMLPARVGHVLLFGEDVTSLGADRRVRMGLAYMSEGAVFPTLTVEDNVRLGAYGAKRKVVRERVAETFEQFPDLAGRRRTLAVNLSGGQRKLLGVAKCLASKPRLLVMDEPSSGLSPRYVDELVARLGEIRTTTELTLLIAEQNIAFLKLADAVSVVESGRVRYSGSPAGLDDDEKLRAAFFGIGGKEPAR